MTGLQKWAFWLVALGAGFMILSKPDAFYKAASGLRNLTAGSIVDVTTGGKGVA